MARDQYYQECFEIGMEDCGCGHLLAQMTKEQREWIGGAIAGGVENEGMAFHRPESPLIGENERLKRKLKWERELETCRTCSGTGRERYNAGPWAVNTVCSRCQGDGKSHPRGEREPA